MNKKFTALLAFSILFTACSTTSKLKYEDNHVTKTGIITLSASKIKTKSSKFNIDFTVANESNKGFIILLAEMQCFKGGERGVLKHTFFNTGERTIDFRTGEIKNFRLVCKLQGSSEGPAKIVVKKVYENLNNDGKTMGKVMAENIEWTDKRSAKNDD